MIVNVSRYGNWKIIADRDVHVLEEPPLDTTGAAGYIMWVSLYEDGITPTRRSRTPLEMIRCG